MKKSLSLLGILGVALMIYCVRRPGPLHPAAVMNSEPTMSALAKSDSRKPTPKVREAGAQPSAPSAATPVSTAQTPAPSPEKIPAAQVEPLPAELASVSPETVLENMRTTVRQYGATFAGNPVGTNLEITQALAGANPKHINFLKADGNRVNNLGELVDPWGTPYFFHQISGKEMEIRSAGPDRVMYTGDDLVIR